MVIEGQVQEDEGGEDVMPLLIEPEFIQGLRDRIQPIVDGVQARNQTNLVVEYERGVVLGAMLMVSGIALGVLIAITAKPT
jgi:hypothetical protein